MKRSDSITGLILPLAVGLCFCVPVQAVESSTDASTGQLVIPSDRMDYHLPDITEASEASEKGLELGRKQDDGEQIKYHSRVLERIGMVRRPQQITLSLEEAIERALANSFIIDIKRFNPAIETTRVVEAEAAFDSVFFTNATKNKIDRPTGSELAASQMDIFNLDVGLRKLLPTGAQVGATYGLQRQWTAFQYQTVNPEYFSDLALELRQPLLRGFGLDYNRSLIRIADNNRRISVSEFRRQVRDTLRQVEELYWGLVYARRNVVITARVLADYEEMYDYSWARREFDITPVQIASVKANVEQSVAAFVQVRSDLLDAEDRLIAALNDPELDLADDIEIIPTGSPSLDHIVVDRVAEAQVALDNRPEVHEGQLRISNAKIAVGRAKIDQLPKLDTVFSYTVDGLAGTADSSFDQMSTHNFVEYYIGVNFEVPIGNRSARAAHHRARLQYSQALASLKATLEEVILDVNVTVRRLETRYDQIGPSFELAEARDREVTSVVARAERKDLATLNTELSARQNLANARRTLLNSMIDYNLSMVDLERAKGTLLQFYNVVLSEDQPEQE